MIYPALWFALDGSSRYFLIIFIKSARFEFGILYNSNISWTVSNDVFSSFMLNVLFSNCLITLQRNDLPCSHSLNAHRWYPWVACVPCRIELILIFLNLVELSWLIQYSTESSSIKFLKLIDFSSFDFRCNIPIFVPTLRCLYPILAIFLILVALQNLGIISLMNFLASNVSPFCNDDNAFLHCFVMFSEWFKFVSPNDLITVYVVVCMTSITMCRY